MGPKIVPLAGCQAHGPHDEKQGLPNMCSYLALCWHHLHECRRAKSLSAVSDSLLPYGPQPARLLCPWESAGGLIKLLVSGSAPKGSPQLLWAVAGAPVFAVSSGASGDGIHGPKGTAVSFPARPQAREIDLNTGGGN